MGGGKTFTVTAEHNGPREVYVRRRTLDGKPFGGDTIPHATVVAGGELTAQMSARPGDDGR